MDVQTNKPLRGPKYRSRAFQEYLLRQDTERAAEIMAGEEVFNERVADAGSVPAAAERVYEETMEGPESKVAGDPAGIHVGD